MTDAEEILRAEVCPRCQGRRVVFDPLSLLLTIGLPIALLLDAGRDRGTTKRKCPVCLGKGWLIL